MTARKNEGGYVLFVPTISMRFLRSPMIFLCGVAVALATAAFGQEIVTQATLQFPDVIPNTFYTPSVNALVRSGVVQGYSDGSFGPDDPVTRAQVSVMINRYDQNVIALLRKQVDQLRAELNLGSCGDETVQVGEECDDGNATNDDGCSANCLKEKQIPQCVDGTASDASDGCNVCVCKNGNLVCTTKICSPVTGVCGNGTVEAPEQCDDGNPWNFDGCSKTCETIANEKDMIVQDVTYDISDAEPGRFNVTFHIPVSNPTTLLMRDFQVQIKEVSGNLGTIVEADIPAGTSKVIDLSLRSAQRGKQYQFTVNAGHRQRSPISVFVPLQ